MSATEDTLGLLHEMTAQALMDVIKNGVPIVNKETGEVEGYAPAPAPYIAAAIKFLKDNDIGSLPTEDNALGELAKSLPDFSVDVDLKGRAN